MMKNNNNNNKTYTIKTRMPTRHIFLRERKQKKQVPFICFVHFASDQAWRKLKIKKRSPQVKH